MHTFCPLFFLTLQEKSEKKGQVKTQVWWEFFLYLESFRKGDEYFYFFLFYFLEENMNERIKNFDQSIKESYRLCIT